MLKYEAYKDSGATWIGNVPSTWEVDRLKNHLKRTDAKNPGGVQVLSLYRELGIVPKDSRDDNHNVTSEDTSKYKYVQPGDFVVNKMKAWQGSVAVSDYEGIVSPAYYVYKFLDDRFHKRYFHYLIRSCYKEEFMRLSAGIRIGQWDLSSDDLDCVLVLLPTKEEQEAIADFLDKKVAHIDSVIAEAKASIEEYKAWKASIIYEAVTKGLDPNAEMKDSGVEWIGTIPKNWKVQRLKNLISEPLQYGANETGVEYSDELPRYIRITDVTANGTLKEEGKLSLPEDIAATYILQDGDILFARSGGTVGKAFFYKAEYGRAAFAGYMIRARVNKKLIHPKLVYFSTLSANYADWKETTMTQATIQNIGANKYNDFCIVVPPTEEQAKLVSYMENETKQIDELITEKEILISDLEAYKKSLIFEAVTGKRWVC